MSPEFVTAPYTSILQDHSPYASVVAQAAVDTANRLGIDTIVAFTESGTTARLLSKHRPIDVQRLFKIVDVPAHDAVRMHHAAQVSAP